MTSTSTFVDVLIVGAGPTGLLLATELAAQGIKLRIIDKAPAPSIKSKALVVQVRSLEVFERIGVIDEALKRGKPLEGLAVQTARGKITDVRFEEIKSPYPHPLVLEQSENEAILNAKLQTYGVQVERPVELVDFKQDAEGVQAVIKTASGATDVVRAKFVVGCDGAHSTVRHRLDLPFEGKSYLQQFVLADVQLDWALGHEKLQIFVSELGFMAVVPLPQENLYRLITTEKDLSLEHDPSIAELQEFVDRLLPVPARVTPGPWTARFKISCRKVNRYGEGRVFLAGDAAHIHSPAGGLGMNTGMQDAYNLAWKLALVSREQAPQALLQSYEKEREPIAQDLLKTTDRLFFTIGGGVTHPVLRFAQNYLIPIAFGFGPARRKLLKLVSQLGVNYAKSEIVAEDNGASKFIRAGYRLPNVELPASEKGEPEKQQLWDLIRPRTHHVLLIDDAEQRLEIDTTVPYQIHQLPKQTIDGKVRTIIVRPDGYVGAHFRGLDREKIAAYFARLDGKAGAA